MRLCHTAHVRGYTISVAVDMTGTPIVSIATPANAIPVNYAPTSRDAQPLLNLSTHRVVGRLDTDELIRQVTAAREVADTAYALVNESFRLPASHVTPRLADPASMREPLLETCDIRANLDAVYNMAYGDERVRDAVRQMAPFASYLCEMDASRDGADETQDGQDGQTPARHAERQRTAALYDLIRRFMRLARFALRNNMAIELCHLATVDDPYDSACQRLVASWAHDLARNA